MKTWKKLIYSGVLAALVAAVPVMAGAEAMMKDPYAGVMKMEQNGMEYVPLRQFAENMGYQVTWNNMDKTATLVYHSKDGMMGQSTDMMQNKSMDSMTDKTMNDMTDKSMTDKTMNDMTDKSMMAKTYTLVIKEGSTKIIVNGVERDNMHKPMIINGKTYVATAFADMFIIKMM